MRVTSTMPWERTGGNGCSSHMLKVAYIPNVLMRLPVGGRQAGSAGNEQLPNAEGCAWNLAPPFSNWCRGRGRDGAVSGICGIDGGSGGGE